MHVHNNIKSFHTATYKEKTNNKKHVIFQLYNMKLQKEVKSYPKRPSCKKVCSPQECCCEKDVKSKVAGCDGRLKEKKFIMAIQVNLVPNCSEATQIHLNCCY